MKFLYKNSNKILAVFVVSFLALTIFVMVYPPSWMDKEFSEEIQEYHTPTLDFLMKAISWFGLTYSSIITVSVSAILLLIAKKRRAALFCLATLLIGLVNYAIKVLVNRPRPGKDLVRLIIDPQHQSFPSGHVSFYIVFFGFMAFLLHHHKWLTKPVRSSIVYFCFFMILTIPISRIYLGAHWLTDVLGGFLLGCLFLSIQTRLYLKNKN